ncbi:MAG: hypothetical protein ACYDFU_10315 [Nitrospirota bacterium]
MRLTSAFLVLFLLLDGIFLYNIQKKIDTAKTGAQISELAEIPSGKYLKKVSLGQDSLLADIIWLQVIQVMGDKKISQRNAKWIYHAVDSATDLDPKFYYMTELGGIFLTTMSDDHDLSIKLLKKGFDNNPDVWELPFFIGFNYFFYLNNFKQAAYYIGRAAELPGRPPFVPLLASRLYAQSGDPRFGLELTEAIYKSTKNDKVKDALRKRMNELQVEINLDALESAAKVFKNKFGRYPATIGELLAAGLIKSEPVDQLGGEYVINPETGEASNTKLPRRLRIYRKGKN